MLKDIRKKINDFVFANTNNIDKLITDKVNDYILVEEQPLPIKIGKKTIFIGNLTLENNYKYWEMYGKIMANIGCKFINFELMNDSAELYKHIMASKKLYKQLCKLIKKTILKQQAYYLNSNKEREIINWTNCTYRYFKKYITIEKLLQILKLIYLYNFDAEKKNWQILLPKKEEEAKRLMETYIYFWLSNLSGLTGKFQLSRLTNVDYWDNESQREIIPIVPEKNKVKNGK